MVAAPHGHVALDALFEINGEWHDKQRTLGVTDPNSGGTTIFISPGLRLTVENWSSYVLVGIPVVNDYNGIQATPTWRCWQGSPPASDPDPQTDAIPRKGKVWLCASLFRGACRASGNYRPFGASMGPQEEYAVH